jgi:hypothetical protein
LRTSGKAINTASALTSHTIIVDSIHNACVPTDDTRSFDHESCRNMMLDRPAMSVVPAAMDLGGVVRTGRDGTKSGAAYRRTPTEFRTSTFG